MSLIEEALRKQREENDQTQAQTQSTETTKLSMMPTTVTPPPMPPEPPAEEETPESRRAWPLLAAIFGVGMLLIVAIFLLLFFGLKVWRAKPAVKPAAGVVARPAPAAPRKASSAPATNASQQVTRIVAEPVLPPADTNPAPIATAAPDTPVVPKTVTTEDVPRPNEPDTTPKPSPAVQEPGVIRIEGTPAPAPVPAGEKKSVVAWPRLTVTGLIGTAHGSKGAAIINGQLLGPGNTIDGVKIIAVNKQGVQLSFGGQVRTLPAGSSTE